jgi:hypothetical protein
MRSLRRRERRVRSPDPDRFVSAGLGPGIGTTGGARDAGPGQRMRTGDQAPGLCALRLTQHVEQVFVHAGPTSPGAGPRTSIAWRLIGVSARDRSGRGRADVVDAARASGHLAASAASGEALVFATFAAFSGTLTKRQSRRPGGLSLAAGFCRLMRDESSVDRPADESRDTRQSNRALCGGRRSVMGLPSFLSPASRIRAQIVTHL